jgi:hypothetical protein
MIREDFRSCNLLKSPSNSSQLSDFFLASRFAKATRYSSSTTSLTFSDPYSAMSAVLHHWRSPRTSCATISLLTRCTNLSPLSASEPIRCITALWGPGTVEQDFAHDMKILG